MLSRDTRDPAFLPRLLLGLLAVLVLWPGIRLAELDPRVLFQADLPAGSAVQVHAQDDAGGAWTAVPFQETLGATVGSVELAHELANFNAARLRVRLTLTGSHTARPVLRNLRVVVL